VRFEQRALATITDFDECLGRANHVGEHHDSSSSEAIHAEEPQEQFYDFVAGCTLLLFAAAIVRFLLLLL